MKIEAVKALRDHLKETKPTRFHMGGWLFDAKNLHPNECGTAGCLAGHVCIMTGKDVEKMLEVEEKRNDEVVPDFAQCVLGLTDIERQHMFLGGWSRRCTAESDINRAIAYLDKVIETGNVFVKLED